MKEDDAKQIKERAVKFLTDSLGIHRTISEWVGTREHYREVYFIDDQWVENSLAEYIVAHAEYFEISYERVPYDVLEFLPKKGETPVHLRIPWKHTEKNGIQVSEKGGYTRVSITWDDGSMTFGESICSVLDTFTYAVGRSIAVHRAVRKRINIVRAEERAATKEAKFQKNSKLLNKELSMKSEEVTVSKE